MKILVIQLKQIGDVLLSTSIFENIKKKYPNAIIDYMVYENAAPLIENNPNINKLIVINKKEQKNLFLLLKKIFLLKREKYDITLDLILLPLTALVTLVINSKIKVCLKKNKVINRLVYNRRVDRPKDLKSTIEKRNYLLKGIDEEWNDFQNDIKIYLNDSEKQMLKDKMMEKGVDFSKPILAFGINSRREYKIWPKEYFVEVIEYCISKYNANIIFHNSPEERKYAEEMKAMISRKDKVFENIETKNIRELACLFSNIDIYIGNEGGPRHIAEAVGKPTFTINYLKGEKSIWIPNEGNFHRVIELKDVYNMDDKNYKEYQTNKTNKDSLEERYKLKPEFVIDKLDNMMGELSLNKDTGRQDE